VSDRVSYAECLSVASRTPALVAEFDRLAGTHLSALGRRSPLDAMIDEATGRDREALARWMAFVYECVWCRLPEDVRAGSGATT
jgi:hypothetical protein